MEEKSSYQQKVEAQLEEWKADLEVLKAKAKDVTVDLQAEYNEKIKELEPKIAEGKAKLAELVDTADDAWDDVKEGAESIWKQMKETFNNVKEKFDKDDEPKTPEAPKAEE